MNIQIYTPQFDRTWDLDFQFIPKNETEFLDFIKNAPNDILLGCGFCFWAKPKKGRPGLYLFPGEWYDCIPEGFQVVDISGESEFFKKGFTDDDTRFGCLPYGIFRF